MGASEPVVVVNQSSGTALVPEEARRLFPGAVLVDCETEDVPARLGELVPQRPPFVAVAGGDGTQRMVAACLVETGVPLLPVPTGTLNHFARQLGIETVDDAEAAGKGSVTREVDIAEVNGEVFVNTSSLGQYPAFVRNRDDAKERAPKALATAVAAWRQLTRNHRLDVGVDGTRYHAWLVFIGNNRYGVDPGDVGERDELTAGVLDVRVLRADRRFARLRAVIALLLGRVGRSRLLVRSESAAAELAVAGDAAGRVGGVEVALDGEVLRLTSPLRYRMRPGALTVQVPEPRV